MADILKDIVPWLSLAVAIVALAVTIYSLRSGRTEARFCAVETRVETLHLVTNTKADMVQWNAMDQRVDALEDRATKLEASLDHLPDKDTTHRLEMSIEQLRADFGILSERLKPVTAISVRLQEAILEKANVRG